MTTKIWIVFGTTGEYSDRSEWPVVAYDTEEAAQARVKAIEEAYQASGIERMSRWDDDWIRATDEFKAQHDPGFSHDYTGTRWYVVSCDFHSGGNS